MELLDTTLWNVIQPEFWIVAALAAYPLRRVPLASLALAFAVTVVVALTLDTHLGRVTAWPATLLAALFWSAVFVGLDTFRERAIRRLSRR